MYCTCVLHPLKLQCPSYPKLLMTLLRIKLFLSALSIVASSPPNDRQCACAWGWERGWVSPRGTKHVVKFHSSPPNSQYTCPGGKKRRNLSDFNQGMNGISSTSLFLILFGDSIRATLVHTRIYTCMCTWSYYCPKF